MTTGYVGRFAPSVTGPLHFGSLLAAVASYADARAHDGVWRLRLDDLDVPRRVPGADSEIQKALERHALYWDGPLVRQSARTHAYRDAFRKLLEHSDVFLCTCSRRQLAGRATYPGTCRARRVHDLDAADRAIHRAAARIRTPAARYNFEDRVFAAQGARVDQMPGDFIVRRRDGLFAYQLAVVVDDHDAEVTDVVRGSDLLDNTPRQLFLLDRLNLPAPRYAHIPVITDRFGAKLSKQTAADAIDATNCSMNIYLALTLLGQEPDPALSREPPETILEWARGHWRIRSVPATPVLGGFVCI